MNSKRKAYTIFVLLMLLFSMIPVAIADSGIIKGTTDKIDVLYICYTSWPTLAISGIEMYYKDDF